VSPAKRLNRSRYRLDVDLMCPRNHVLDGVHIGAMTEPSVCGGSLAVRQITLTTCGRGCH